MQGNDNYWNDALVFTSIIEPNHVYFPKFPTEMIDQRTFALALVPIRAEFFRARTGRDTHRDRGNEIPLPARW